MTKSGTNDIHGSVYDFHRNTATSANSFFNNKSGVARPALLVDVFGAAVGGPIKKNRLYYFLNYEGRQDRSGSRPCERFHRPSCARESFSTETTPYRRPSDS